jgi:hypothetical protein
MKISNPSYAQVTPAKWFLIRILQFGWTELDEPQKYICKY